MTYEEIAHRFGGREGVAGDLVLRRDDRGGPRARSDSREAGVRDRHEDVLGLRHVFGARDALWPQDMKEASRLTTREFALGVILRTGPHSIGPKTMFDALNSAIPDRVAEEVDRVVELRGN